MEEELRKQAVQRHFAGESPKAIYTSLNRSKKWFFKWLNRFQSGAADWYKEHSRAPFTRPYELGIAEKELIVSTRVAWNRRHLHKLAFLPSSGRYRNWGCPSTLTAPSTAL